MDSGTLGGIVGSVGGVMGGLIGTYFSIKNTHGSRERAFVVRGAVLCWLGVSAFLACLLLLPMRWSPLLWLLYLPALFWFLRWGNARQNLARAEDTAEAGPPNGQDVDP